MKSSALLAPGLSRPDWTVRERPEMFVAIIICLRGHRYKRGSARTSSSSYFSSSSSSSVAPQIVFFLSCDLAVLSLDFSTSISYLPGTSLVPYLLAFRRTCAELSGCVCATVPGRRRKTKEILEQIGNPRGQTGKGTRTRNVRASKRTLRKRGTNKNEIRN